MSAPVEPVKRHHPRWEPLLRLSVLLLFLLGCAYVVVQLLSLRATVDAQQAGQTADTVAIEQLSTALKTTQDQLTQHGITPKAPPPAQIVQGIPGAAGQSIVGPAGPAGQNGVSPDPQAIANLVLAMIHPVPGPAGSVGPVGPAGAAGAAGKDSTVPGPAGPAGSAGKDGANGQAGKDGAQGAAGPAGPAGPAPSGWSFTAADGTVYDCAPDTAGSTHYSCTARQKPPPPPPSPSQSATTPKQTTPHRAATPVSTGPGRP